VRSISLVNITQAFRVQENQGYVWIVKEIADPDPDALSLGLDGRSQWKSVSGVIRHQSIEQVTLAGTVQANNANYNDRSENII
jgi:hypothetical protein